MLRLHTRAALLALGLLTLAGCGGGGALLMDPQPVPSAGDLAVTHNAILAAMARRHWVPEQNYQGQIVARLDIRSHVVRVLIRYDQSWVTFQYMDSLNLGYQVRGNAAYIHRNYNTWVRNLASDTDRELRAAMGPPGAGGPTVIVVPRY